MADLTLVAESGRPTGSRASGRLLAEGKIPAVVYGHGDPVAVTVDRRELRRVLTTPAGTNALINLQVDGTGQLVIAKELQRDPIRRTVRHVDFLRVNLDEEIEVEVSLELTGDDAAVTGAGGVVDLAMGSLTVIAKPRAVPASIPVDVSSLRVGDVVRVADLTLPAGVRAAADPDAVVASAMASTTEAETEPVAESEPAAEPES